MVLFNWLATNFGRTAVFLKAAVLVSIPGLTWAEENQKTTPKGAVRCKPHEVRVWSGRGANVDINSELCYEFASYDNGYIIIAVSFTDGDAQAAQIRFDSLFGFTQVEAKSIQQAGTYRRAFLLIPIKNLEGRERTSAFALAETGEDIYSVDGAANPQYRARLINAVGL